MLDFYQLREQPFGMSPDPRFLHLGPSHREALASMAYGIKMNRGLMALVAPPGMGKTTLVFRLLEHLKQSARTAFLFQTQCDSAGLLQYILNDLGINTRGQDFVGMHQQLNSLLVDEARAGRRLVVVIDEAQNLDEDVLETARLLTDFETPSQKLLQIVLAGQPQLALKLKQPRLAQLRQRICAVGRLGPLALPEVGDYINHRLQVAGCAAMPLFTPAAVFQIFAISEGVPRTVNNLCFNAMSLGYALGAKKIDADLVTQAATDLDLEPLVSPILQEQLASRTGTSSSADKKGTRLSSDDFVSATPELQFQRLERTANRPTEAHAQTVALPNCPRDKNPILDATDGVELVLEDLNSALFRQAEILAEVIELPGVGQVEDNTSTLAFSTIEEDVAAAPFLPVTGHSFLGDLSGGIDRARVEPPLLPTLTSRYLGNPPKSYAAKSKRLFRRLAMIAALALMSFAGFYYRLDIAATFTELRGIVTVRSLLQPSISDPTIGRSTQAEKPTEKMPDAVILPEATSP